MRNNSTPPAEFMMSGQLVMPQTAPTARKQMAYGSNYMSNDDLAIMLSNPGYRSKIVIEEKPREGVLVSNFAGVVGLYPTLQRSGSLPYLVTSDRDELKNAIVSHVRQFLDGEDRTVSGKNLSNLLVHFELSAIQPSSARAGVLTSAVDRTIGRIHSHLKMNVTIENASARFKTITVPLDVQLRVWASSREAAKDLRIYEQLSQLVSQKVCPNFPVLYTHFRCDASSDFASKAGITVNGNKMVVAALEPFSLTFAEWITRKSYTTEGGVRTAVNSGVHTQDTWKSVLFQLLMAGLVLIDRQVEIGHITVDDITIQDIHDGHTSETHASRIQRTNGRRLGSVIYAMDDVRFYVPCHGYLLRVDCPAGDSERRPLTNEKLADVFGTVGSNSLMPHTSHSQRARIPDDVIALANSIQTSLRDGELPLECLMKNFAEYLDAKLGSDLTSDEVRHVRGNPAFNEQSRVKPGTVVAYMSEPGIYKWMVVSDRTRTLHTLAYKQGGMVKFQRNVTVDQILLTENYAPIEISGGGTIFDLCTFRRAPRVR